MAEGRWLQTLCGYLHDARGASTLTDRELLGRFVTEGEQEAFQALVHRHGSLVLGVCRRLLGHEQDAEDAFQATFLVLAKKAASLGCRSSLRNWLHEVACRTARKACAERARRRRHERQAAPVDRNDPATLTWEELRGVLDEELARLPEQYRVPLLLCLLEGKTQDEAASELGWSVGSLRGRLYRGRQVLQARLARRGVTLSAALTPLLVGRGEASVAVARLLGRTSLAAMHYRAGNSLAGLASNQALCLAKGTLSTMKTSLMTTCAARLLLALAALGGGRLAYQSLSAGPPAAEPGPQEPKRQDGQTTTALGIEFLHEVTLERLEAGATIDLCNSSHGFRDVPAEMTGRLYTKRHGFQGVMRFRVKQPQRIRMALFGDDWGGGGNPSGGWLEEVISRKDLEKKGWKEVGKLLTRERQGQGQAANWIVFERDCKEGEAFAIRNHKYLAPILILGRPADRKEKAPGSTARPGMALADPVAAELKTLARQALAIKRGPGLRIKGDQSLTGLDLARILGLTGQKADRAKFTTDHRDFRRDVEQLVRNKRTWALCSLLDHPNVDAKILAAQGLGNLGDPNSVPVLLAAAKSNDYHVNGSENATLHAIYRSSLALALGTITQVAPPDDDKKADPLVPDRQVDFDTIEKWVRKTFLSETDRSAD